VDEVRQAAQTAGRFLAVGRSPLCAGYRPQYSVPSLMRPHLRRRRRSSGFASGVSKLKLSPHQFRRPVMHLRQEGCRWRRCKPQATIRGVSFSSRGAGLSQSGQGSGCALQSGHLDRRALGGHWRAGKPRTPLPYPERKKMGEREPGTGRGRRQAKRAALIITVLHCTALLQQGQARTRADGAEMRSGETRSQLVNKNILGNIWHANDATKIQHADRQGPAAAASASTIFPNAAWDYVCTYCMYGDVHSDDVRCMAGLVWPGRVWGGLLPGR
jgi:hypothetical protein